MTEKVYDVVIVGGGNAALCAALSAREHGASVLVLERAPEQERGGIGRTQFPNEALVRFRLMAPQPRDERRGRDDAQDSGNQ